MQKHTTRGAPRVLQPRQSTLGKRPYLFSFTPPYRTLPYITNRSNLEASVRKQYGQFNIDEETRLDLPDLLHHPSSGDAGCVDFSNYLRDV